jgi:hypothetical protein
MRIEALRPPDLAKLGTPRIGFDPTRTNNPPDIKTVWRTPYPVLTPYVKLMVAAGISPYGGGSRHAQGPTNVSGFITSGYRDTVLEGNRTSPHLFALAIDFIVGDDAALIQVAMLAVNHFPRVGIYLGRGFLHVDAAPDNWLTRYDKKRYWVKREAAPSVSSLYVSSDDLALIITAARRAA